MLIRVGTIITASPVRYNKWNHSTLQNYITQNLLELCPNYSLEDFVKHIVVRTVEFIEDPFRAGLELPCFDMYSTAIAELVSSTWHILTIMLRWYSRAKHRNVTRPSRDQ